MSSQDQQQLVQFAKGLNWEEHIKDAIVADSLIKIRNHITQKLKENQKSGSKEEVDLATAKRVKLVVVGDGAVGKTSLLIRFATGEFPNEYVPTVFENYTAQTKRPNGETVLLHLWDTAGQEDYDRLRPLSYPGADIVLLCFSTISQASYEAVRDKWAPEVHHFIPTVPTILIGTKIDLREDKHPDPNSGKFEPVTPDQGTAMAKQIGSVKYMEVSSKTGKGVSEVYNEAISLVFQTREGGGIKRAESGGGSASGKKKKGGCLLM